MTTNITAQRIVSLRESRGLLQPDLARLAQIEQSYVSKLERGKAPNVSGIILARIARALGTSVDFLLGVSDDPAPRPIVNHPMLKDPLLQEFIAAWPDLDLKQRQAFVHLAKKAPVLKAKRERGEE